MVIKNNCKCSSEDINPESTSVHKLGLYSCVPDDGLSMNEIDLKLTSYNVIASRLGLTERRPIPEPMPFPSPDPLGASTLAPSLCDPPEALPGIVFISLQIVQLQLKLEGCNALNLCILIFVFASDIQIYK